MNVVVAKSLLNSYSYADYRQIVKALLAEGKVSGAVQSEALLHYSLLNETRMNRLAKTIVIPPDVIDDLRAIKGMYTWLVISEGWCGDAAQILPVLSKMENATPNIEMRLVFRDDNLELMDQYLTNNGRAIPKLLLIDETTGEVVGSWGPRPSEAAKLVADYKAAHGTLDETIKTELQLWYLHDKGLSTIKEVMELFPAE